jgi:uncharacterized membrane protein
MMHKHLLLLKLLKWYLNMLRLNLIGNYVAYIILLFVCVCVWNIFISTNASNIFNKKHILTLVL